LQRPVAVGGGRLQHSLDRRDRAGNDEDEVHARCRRGPSHAPDVVEVDVGRPVEAAGGVDDSAGVVEQRAQFGPGRQRPRQRPRIVAAGEQPVHQTAPQRTFPRRHHDLHGPHGATRQ
jgi:hypothetical protein